MRIVLNARNATVWDYSQQVNVFCRDAVVLNSLFAHWEDLCHVFFRTSRRHLYIQCLQGKKELLAFHSTTGYYTMRHFVGMQKQKGYRASDGRSPELVEHCGEESIQKVNAIADNEEA